MASKQFVLSSLPSPQGLKRPGNIDLNGRPIVANPDGSYSTELSFSVGTDQGETLLPRIVNGQLLSEQAAIDHFRKTGEQMGVFDTPENADRYATMVHKRQPLDSYGRPNYEAQAAINPPVASYPPVPSKRGLR